jgi:hypothetical protein
MMCYGKLSQKASRSSRPATAGHPRLQSAFRAAERGCARRGFSDREIERIIVYAMEIASKL